MLKLRNIFGLECDRSFFLSSYKIQAISEIEFRNIFYYPSRCHFYLFPFIREIFIVISRYESAAMARIYVRVCSSIFLAKRCPFAIFHKSRLINALPILYETVISLRCKVKDLCSYIGSAESLNTFKTYRYYLI